MKRLIAVLTLLVLVLPSAFAADYTADVRIQVLIDIQTSEGRFRDALYFSKSEFDALSNAQVSQMKADRITAWVNAVRAARTRPATPPTRQQLEAERSRLEAELAAINERLR